MHVKMYEKMVRSRLLKKIKFYKNILYLFFKLQNENVKASIRVFKKIQVWIFLIFFFCEISREKVWLVGQFITLYNPRNTKPIVSKMLSLFEIPYMTRKEANRKIGWSSSMNAPMPPCIPWYLCLGTNLNNEYVINVQTLVDY